MSVGSRERRDTDVPAGTPWSRDSATCGLEVGLETLTTDVSYGLDEWGIRDEDHYRQLHRFAVTQRDLFETCRKAALSCCACGPAGTSVCRRSHGQRDIQSRCRKNRAHPITGAATTLRRLSDEGYRIRIITHRLFINIFHEASVRQTIR